MLVSHRRWPTGQWGVPGSSLWILGQECRRIESDIGNEVVVTQSMTSFDSRIP